MAPSPRPVPVRRRGGPVLAALLIGALACGPAGAPARAAAPAGGDAAAATGADAFTPAQRAAIVAVVRQALRTDPSILSDAVASLRAAEQHRAEADTDTAVRAHRGALAAAPGDAVLGGAAADVTLVEFYDPRCPYCRRVLPDLDALLAGDRTVRVVEKLIPILGPNSVVDAQAIQAAALQGRAIAMQHALMTDNGAPGLDRVRALAPGAGVDATRLLRDMKSATVNDALERNLQLAKSLGLTGTPTFIVGRQVIPGAVDLASLRQAVRTARAE